MGLLFRVAVWAGIAYLAVAVTISMASDTPTETITGDVTAGCMTIQAHPVPTAFTVDGVKLAGNGWLGEGIGTGVCTAPFTITGVPIEKAYRVDVATMSKTVTAVAADSMSLTEF